MRTPRSNAPKVFCSHDGGLDPEFERAMRDNISGHDPKGRGETPPGPTRTTSHPWAETNQRKPYQPVEDTSTPSLDDGVSYRQKL
jgi:hypothetical protein